MRRAGSRVAGAALAALAALAACGSGGVGRSPSWRTRAEPAERPAARRGPTLVVAPAGAGAAAYNARRRAAPPRSPLFDAVVAAVADAAEAAGAAAPAPDARLFAVAADLAPVAREDAPIPYALVEFTLRHHGIVEPTPHLILMWGALDRPEVLAAQLRGRLPELFATAAIRRVGVGARRRGKAGVVVLVLQPSHIDTDPIPRRIEADGELLLRARVLPPYTSPELFVTHEDGSVSEPRLRSEGQGRLSARVSCRGRRGRQQIEITAVDRRGSAVLANFPVWCAVAPPRRTEVAAAAPGSEAVTDARAAEAAMIELVNRDRAEAGLPALAVDPRLSAVARAHSEQMRATGAVAHVSPTTGSAADRVRAAGIRTALVLENVARAYGVLEAEQGLMNSPGHRANILARDATHLGVGIALGDMVSGHRELFVTQVFTRVPPVVDPDRAARRLRERIEAGSALAYDPDLAAIAASFAAAVAGGASSEEASRASARQLDALSSRYRRVTTIVNPVTDLDRFPVDQVGRERAMTHFGVGVAQGPHELIGDGAIHVVVLVGQRR